MMNCPLMRSYNLLTSVVDEVNSTPVWSKIDRLLLFFHLQEIANGAHGPMASSHVVFENQPERAPPQTTERVKCRSHCPAVHHNECIVWTQVSATVAQVSVSGEHRISEGKLHVLPGPGCYSFCARVQLPLRPAQSFFSGDPKGKQAKDNILLWIITLTKLMRQIIKTDGKRSSFDIVFLGYFSLENIFNGLAHDGVLCCILYSKIFILFFSLWNSINDLINLLQLAYGTWLKLIVHCEQRTCERSF
jgi:hypothetical protein